ncbi:hypothetical protein WME94_02055 [Sorangium sp. So ce429]
MSEHERLVPWRERVVPGQVYRAPSAWTDDAGRVHEPGEEWTFLRFDHELLDALKAAYVVVPHLLAHRGTFSELAAACRSSSQPGASAAHALASAVVDAITGSTDTA